MQIAMRVDMPLQAGSHYSVDHADTVAGGPSLIQGIAASRAGAKVSQIGVIGDDIFGKHIQDTLRREGIKFSGVAISQDHDTGVIQSITDSKNALTLLTTQVANTDISAVQIPDTALHPRTLVALQNDINTNINLDILNRATAREARTIMSLQHGDFIDPAFFQYLDYLVIKADIYDEVRDLLWPEHWDEDKIRRPLKCIVLNDACDDVNIIDDKNRDTNAPSEISKKPYRTPITFDVFCGTLAACLQAGVDVERSVQYAKTSVCLHHEKIETAPNMVAAIPYLADIQAALDKV